MIIILVLVKMEPKTLFQVRSKEQNFTVFLMLERQKYPRNKIYQMCGETT